MQFIQLLRRHWFIVSLILCLAIGFLLCESLKIVGETTLLRYAIVFCVMFVMAWSIKFGQIWNTIRRPKATLIAIGINFLLVPLLAWPLSLVLNPSLAAGLIATAATPCTLVSAVVWTRRGGGNDVTALMTTMVTNMMCFVVTPMWITLLAARNVETFSFSEMFTKLFLLIVLPILLAQLARLDPSVASWSSSNKPLLSRFGQYGILAMVLIGAINTGLLTKDMSFLAFWGSALLLTVICLVLHFAVLFSGIYIAKWANCLPEDQIAVGISGSQKTMMVGLTTSMDMGVSVLPMIVYHTIQLIGDTPVVDWFRRKHFSRSGSAEGNSGGAGYSPQPHVDLGRQAGSVAVNNRE